AIIDLKNEKKTLDNKVYELNSEGVEMCFADGELIEKNRALKVDCSESILNKIIDSYKFKNHKIGNISTTYHSINLISNFKRILPEYPVPLGIRVDVENHLNELIQSGIISEAESNYISPAFVIRKNNG
ncbi:hypothetical protein DMUE_5815, partial [Dictyocoela muelleri]